MPTQWNENVASIQDFERIGTLHLNGKGKKYYSFPSGTWRQQTYVDCTEAFKRYRLRPRVLRDVSNIDLSWSVLGQPISFPVCMSPTASHSYAHYDKEVATVKAAAECGIGMVVSSCSHTLLEDIAPLHPSGPLWMQTYMFVKRDVTKAIVRAAEQSGYHALVITIDSCEGRMYRSKQKETDVEFCKGRFVNFYRGVDPDEDDSLEYVLDLVEGYGSTLQELKWLRSFTTLPIVLKGILTGKTAKLAVLEGIADGILVSAHGGRQLDGVPATIDALSEVVQAVQGSGVEVYLDGGVRTGTDVLKALARGARAVFVGRPIIWGLAANGQRGVKQVLDIYRDELRLAMALTGCTRISDISPALLLHESSYLTSQL